MSYTLQQLSEKLNGELQGKASKKIINVAEIQNAGTRDLSFLANPKYIKFIESTKAGALIVGKDFKEEYPNLIKVDNPNLAFSKAISLFRPSPANLKPGIHKTAVISKTAILGSDIYIGPNVVVEDDAVIENNSIVYANTYIGNHARIGAGTIIKPNVTIYHECVLGKNCLIHAGTVIGADGYGFVRTDSNIIKIPQAGHVIIHDNVEIGSNCSIDRGTLGNTEIGKGTKLDNLIQIAHNVKIGEYCFITGQVGVAGSAEIGNMVTIAGQVGIVGHIKVGDRAILTGKSGITKDVAPGSIMFGFPAQESKIARREMAGIRTIPDIRKRLKNLEKKLKDKDKE